MSRHTRRIAVLLGVIVVLLFAGRWTSGLLADRWWAEEVAPAAAGFITNWHLLRGTLKLAGVVRRGGLVHRPSPGRLPGGRLRPGAAERGQPRVPRGAHAGRAARGGGGRWGAHRDHGGPRAVGARGRGRHRLAGGELRADRTAAAARRGALRRAAAALARAARLLLPARHAGARARLRDVSPGRRDPLARRPPRHQQPRPHPPGLVARRPRVHPDVGISAGAVRARRRIPRYPGPGALARHDIRCPGARGRGAGDSAAQRRLGGSRPPLARGGRMAGAAARVARGALDGTAGAGR